MVQLIKTIATHAGLATFVLLLNSSNFSFHLDLDLDHNLNLKF